MSDLETDGFMPCLFSRQGMELDNVKFFRGSSEAISESAFKDELKASADRKRSGSLRATTDAPKLCNTPVDVREFIANM